MTCNTCHKPPADESRPATLGPGESCECGIDPNDQTGPAVGIVAAPRKPWSQSIDRAPVLTPERAAELLADECEPEADEAPREHAYRDPSDASTWHLPPRQVTHEEARSLATEMPARYEREMLTYITEREATEAQAQRAIGDVALAIGLTLDATAEFVIEAAHALWEARASAEERAEKAEALCREVDECAAASRSARDEWMERAEKAEAALVYARKRAELAGTRREVAEADRDHHRAAFDRLAAWVRGRGGDAALDEALRGEGGEQ